MKRITCILGLFLFFAANVFAQGYRISGRIVDSEGPVVGATVMEVGTSIGISTDVDGAYALTVSGPDAVIEVSCLGYEAQTFKASAVPASVSLGTNAQFLQDAVVIGYGTMAKKDLTGAVSVLGQEELKDMPVTNLNSVLQGKIPGLTITSTSGTPGSGSVAHIRGIGSIGGSTTPLYIVDGLPQDGIDNINPGDIESITVHKDASVAAIYGSRGSNGIIIITTKSGAQGKVQVGYDGYIGFQQPWRRPYMLNAEDYIIYKNLAADNAGQERVPAFSTPENVEKVLQFVEKNSGSRAGTDWWKEIINPTALIHNHDISVSGGSELFNMRSSLSFVSQDGIVKGSDYNRISWKNNFGYKISDNISLKGNFGVIDEKRHLVNEAGPALGTVFSAMGSDPITPVFRNNLKDVPDILSQIMNGYEADNKYSQYAGILYSNKRNPIAQIERLRQTIYEYFYVKGGANLEIALTDFLKSNTRFSMDIFRGTKNGFDPKYTLNSIDFSNVNKVTVNNSRSEYMLGEQTLSYDQAFGKFKLGALIGVSAEQTKGEIANASIEDVPNNEPDMAILSAGTSNHTVSGYPYESAMASLFGRINLNYDDKYLLAANLRRDGSSKFASGHKWGTFPSVSAAWRFSAEPFLAGTKGWLDDGKVRVSYGIIGNQNISGGNYYTTYGTGKYDTVSFGTPTDYYYAYHEVTVGNADLEWEKSKQFDVGLDLTMFNYSLELVVDYFDKTIEKMLLQEPLPGTLGFASTPYSNVGSMSNRGWEFGATWRKSVGDLRYEIAGNISTYQNKVLSLGNGDAIYGSAYNSNVVTKTEVGKPVGYFYGYLTNGIFQNATEVEGSAQRSTAVPGDIRYKDIYPAEEPDDVLDDNDRAMIGSPWPDFVYGLTLSAAWRGFDASIFFQGSQGNDVLNMTLYDFDSGTGYMNALDGILERAWNGEGSTDRYHRISADQGQNQLVSDYYVEDGSYLRIKNVQIGYNFCNNLIHTKWLSNFRVYVSAQNLLTLTKYSGLDPEIGSSSAILNGIDQGYYPQARTFSFGVNLKF